MLRNTLLIFSVTLALAGAAGVLGLFPGWQCSKPVMLWGIGLMIAVLGERWRYRQAEKSTGDNWQKTDERFIDPGSGQLTQVFFDPETGKRRYEVVDSNLTP